MNSKKIISLAVVLIVAVVIIVIVKTVGNRKPSEEALQFFPDAKGKTVASVVIKDAANQVKLARKGDAWYMVPREAIAATETKKPVSGLAGVMGKEQNTPATPPPAGLSASEFPADSAVMAQLLDNIAAMRKNTLVSENPANQSAFEVDSAHGCTVEAFDANEKSLGKVILGKNGADYNSVYGRSTGSNAVYLMLEVARTAFGTDNNRWTDKSIMKFDKATVKQVSIAKKGAPAIVIAKGDSAKKGWQLLEPPKKAGNANGLDSTKVDELIGSLSNLTAAEYELTSPVDSVTGLANPSIAVTVSFAGGTTRSIAVGSQKTGQSKFYVKVPEKPYLYLVNDYDQKKWDKKPEDFENQPPKPVKPSKPVQAVPAPLPAKVKMPVKK